LGFQIQLVPLRTGQLSKPNMLGVPGLHTFKGRVMHTSHYREPADLAGQRVLIVGTGAASGSVGLS
jgi:cation diffusion facilitator CzcD-associated flavoprotein CzcO